MRMIALTSIREKCLFQERIQDGIHENYSRAVLHFVWPPLAGALKSAILKQDS